MRRAADARRRHCEHGCRPPDRGDDSARPLCPGERSVRKRLRLRGGFSFGRRRVRPHSRDTTASAGGSAVPAVSRQAPHREFGGRYDFSANRLHEAEPIAPFLHPLRERIANWAGQPAARFTHALIAEYAQGTQLGWHRDVANFELVVGVSLLSAARMRFRRYPPQPRARSIAIELAPRSVYRLEGEARWEWQHSIPPTPALRYSITFRTLRA
jgi:alkylated DNA repair dioxygenase AlkB